MLRFFKYLRAMEQRFSHFETGRHRVVGRWINDGLWPLQAVFLLLKWLFANAAKKRRKHLRHNGLRQKRG